jgi:hypothetical protein
MRSSLANIAAALVYSVGNAIAVVPQSERDVRIAPYTYTDGPHRQHNDNWNGAHRGLMDADESPRR